MQPQLFFTLNSLEKWDDDWTQLSLSLYRNERSPLLFFLILEMSQSEQN